MTHFQHIIVEHVVKSSKTKRFTFFVPGPNKQFSIQKIFQGRSYIYFADEELNNIWSAGDNGNGQCGIDGGHYIKQYTPMTYFQRQHNLILRLFAETDFRLQEHTQHPRVESIPSS